MRPTTIPIAARVLMLLGICACLTLAAQPAPQAPTAKTNPVRTWTSVNGNTLEGRFVREEEGKIYIERPNGTTVATTRGKLSPIDLAWIDQTSMPSNAVKTLTFTQVPQNEKARMEQYRLVRRLITQTYTQLTNNDRDDKMLAFLERDAQSMYGWKFISSECYLGKNDRKGKIKRLDFLAQVPVPLREAVQMARDKFTLTMPDPVTVRETTVEGEPCWELLNPPDYVSHVYLIIDPETKNIKSFELLFPPPTKP